MPPRFAYWTIILEGKPTAFRAQQKEELLPTFRQLQAKHPETVMKWFARGKLWSSPEEAHAAGRRSGTERRTPDWRPGGEHRDPRERFKLPRDEKRRRFAAKLQRDSRGADARAAPRRSPAAPSERPESHGARPSGERPAQKGGWKLQETRKWSKPVSQRRPWERGRPGPRRESKSAEGTLETRTWKGRSQQGRGAPRNDSRTSGASDPRGRADRQPGSRPKPSGEPHGGVRPGQRNRRSFKAKGSGRRGGGESR
jgi:hypothetical protein